MACTTAVALGQAHPPPFTQQTYVEVYYMPAIALDTGISSVKPKDSIPFLMEQVY